MHEHAITQAVVDQVLAVARRNNATKVSAVKLKVGEDSGIVPASVEFYFRMMTRQTPAETARLDFEKAALRIRCPKCARAFGSVGEMCSCNAGGEIVAGQGITLESIDVE